MADCLGDAKSKRKDVEKEEFWAAYGEQLIKDFHSIFGDQLEWSPEYEIITLADMAEGKAAR